MDNVCASPILPGNVWKQKYDDMVDTAGTPKDRGAACITHPGLSGPAVGRVTDSALDEMDVTDTMPLNE